MFLQHDRTRTNTPWGTSDDAGELAGSEGVRFYSTPSHGGYLVPPKLVSRVPALVRERCAIKASVGDWYEEDCAAAVVAVVFSLCSGDRLNDARGVVVLYFGPIIARALGIDPETFPEALARFGVWEEDKRLRAIKSPDLIVSASGDWHERCPKGAVLVTTADDREHLVTAESYRARTPLNLLSKCVPWVAS